MTASSLKLPCAVIETSSCWVGLAKSHDLVEEEQLSAAEWLTPEYMTMEQCGSRQRALTGCGSTTSTC